MKRTLDKKKKKCMNPIILLGRETEEVSKWERQKGHLG